MKAMDFSPFTRLGTEKWSRPTLYARKSEEVRLPARWLGPRANRSSKDPGKRSRSSNYAAPGGRRYTPPENAGMIRKLFDAGRFPSFNEIFLRRRQSCGRTC